MAGINDQLNATLIRRKLDAIEDPVKAFSTLYEAIWEASNAHFRLKQKW